MRRIVCDTGPLLHLGEAGVRDLLPSAGDVHIPPAVDLEMRSRETAWDVRLARSSLWVAPSVLLAAKAALERMA